jgi:hypothetical protein
MGIWEWAVLKGDIWTTHGKTVADAAVYFPRSFDRTPRNPAEKLSSGYKAWELLLYFYGLGPGLFFGVIPEEYYRHYCKLVVGIRIIYQRRISRKQLQHAHKLLLEWVLEFELLYYQRKIERLHFVRQCVHSLTHLGPETARIGPPSLSAQWTMERIIGILGGLIKQPSNPFANLTEQAKKIAEINALIAIWPELDSAKRDPHGSIDIGHGYILLGPKDDKPHNLSHVEQTALAKFYSGLSNPRSIRAPRSIYRWGRLQIPTEQVARSYWKEVIRSSRTARTDRNLKVRDLTFRFLTFIDVSSQVLHQGAIRIVEARFYFRANIAGTRETLVLCSLYSPGDKRLHGETHGALNVFEYKGEDALIVIQATTILAVVAMVPFGERIQGCPTRFFLVEKFALGVIDIGVIVDQNN